MGAAVGAFLRTLPETRVFAMSAAVLEWGVAISREELVMGNPETPKDSKDSPTAAERRLRGTPLEGAESKTAADHDAYEKRRDPDTELRLDGEEDTLYDDGLDTGDDDPDTLAGTRGKSAGIKP
jgi:hypothetical protein